MAPKISVLPGERRRERVISPDEEARYLAAASEPLSSIATVLSDTGTRPEECFRLQWENATGQNGRNGVLLVTHGKTGMERSVLPMTPRVRAILESQSTRPVGQRKDEYTRSDHVEPSSVRKQHLKAFKIMMENYPQKQVRQFVLYPLRHTSLIRLGQSGCDLRTLARIAGHSSITISARYLHPSEDAVTGRNAKVGWAQIWA